MAKLPSNFVKAASFDNPLRSTASAAVAPVTEAKIDTPPPPVIAVANDDHATMPSSGAAAEDPLAYRFTLRLNERQWRLLHTECLERRMRGDHVKVADILRDIVDAWAESRSRR